MFLFKIKYMNVNIRISRFEISRDFLKCDFLTMGSSDDERLSQLYLELFDAYKKRFMPQNGQFVVLSAVQYARKLEKF